eukprot:TRINITY_DN6353_c0_g1_i1.p3 TRINITY_DN6353_c0_g1~~TRINITY_DN6353_c0_g1_i1.p3  ORF type:complete len:111 (+),score=31.44 TRINITY_DN6353_c0_g1_i1:1-333(+)
MTDNMYFCDIIIDQMPTQYYNIITIHILIYHSFSSYFLFFFFLMIRRPPRSTHCISSAASDVYKRQEKKNGKFQKQPKQRKQDWICKNCKNLNYSFRVVCNRCQLSKPEN